MSCKKQPLFLWAADLHRRYENHQSRRQDVLLPNASWDRCQQLARQLRLANDRGWRGAASRVRSLLAAALDEHARDVSSALNRISPISPIRVQPTLRSIYEDLLTLHDEFRSVSFCTQDSKLSVATEAIVLEGFYLGSFEIRLNWKNLPQDGDYDVVALDPQPASSNESVTHPHVSEKALCQGDAKIPLENALAQGRLLDFFQIVANVLKTYNSSSAYVSLEDWEGVHCADCGESTADEERIGCNCCERTHCLACVVSCEDCDFDFCGTCIGMCEGCESSRCTSCLRECERCQSQVCSSCRLDERCQNCHEETEEKETQPANEPAFQSNSVGQAAVLA